MDLGEIKDEYRARVEPRGKSISEILEEAAKETKAYKELEEENNRLEEENKKLNEFKEKRKESRFYFKAQMERAEPKTAREAEDLQRAKEIFEKLYREELSCLEEENKNLKKELKNAECEFGFACEEIDYRKREDKELRKWIKEHVDYQTQADFRKRFEHK